MKFILLLLLFWLLWTLAKPFVRIYRNVRRAQRGEWINLNDLFGTPGAQRESDAGRRQRAGGWSGIRRTKKKIDPEVGEYVKFKEMPPDPSAPKNETVNYTVEQQVVDVEWEEINK